MNEIKLYKSPIKAIWIIIGCSLFVFPSIYILVYQTNPKMVYWFSAVFFSFGYVVGLINLFDKKPQIILNSNGIWDRSLDFKTISWEDIIDCYELRIHRVKFICLVTTPELSQMKKFPEWVDLLHDDIEAQKFNLSTAHVKVKPDSLIKAIKQLSADSGENRNRLIGEIKAKNLLL
ncbi:MAG: hypothetical protein EOO45_17935 [Flavobacterium sp.]|nr:MAG: hypothetical protein EOO45_17935 [Flavobacterium sp.]